MILMMMRRLLRGLGRGAFGDGGAWGRGAGWRRQRAYAPAFGLWGRPRRVRSRVGRTLGLLAVLCAARELYRLFRGDSHDGRPV